jgi:carboxyl-terminal processing protease
MIAEGKTRAADPSLNTRMASAPPVAALPQASAPQTVIATTVQNPQPASSMSPAIAAAAASSGPRYALIIGNSQYGALLGRLPNPVNDAQSVAAALKAVGFNVDLVTDADQRAMKRAISRFGERLAAARGATGLFYYAGHGIQSRGTNYLIPVAAPIEREADLDLEAVAADTVLAQMEDAGAATSIVILDACRNMPLARSFRSSSRGLARMDAPNGSFIAYSTAPGSTAADGDGRNSPFASALVRQIGQKGLPIEVMFRGIRKDVLQATGGQQTPWDSSSLVDPFYFVP